MQVQRNLQIVGVSVLFLYLGASSFAESSFSKGTQVSSGVAQFSLDGQASAMALGKDGMLYILSGRGGRYDKGTLSKFNPEGFSRLQRGEKGRFRASAEDLTEVYVFGRPGEPSNSFEPESILAGADGRLYISGYWGHVAKFDPKRQSLEWIKYGPEHDDPSANNVRETPVISPGVTAFGAPACAPRSWLG